MNKTLLLLFLVFNLNMLHAQTTVSTFHAISLYWSPQGGESAKNVLVQFREIGTNDWNTGHPMKYQPIAGCGNDPVTGLRYDRADYRGSIVDLNPGTTYEIQLTLEGTATTATIQETTWTENFPIGQTITPGNMNTEYEVTTSGNANGYLLIDGTNSTIDITDDSPQCITLNQVSYVILRGFTLKNGGQHGIRLYDCDHIVIEDCDISGWGQEDVAGSGFGRNYQAGIYGHNNSATSSVFQRNKIHHPRWDANSWAEPNDPNEPVSSSNNHPSGPQAIALGNCYEGNNVIRYNEFYSDADHFFNDVLGMWENGSYAGFPGPDSDIYGNYITSCWDDGIESEGSNTNVRIFANYIDQVFIPIANAATSIGPLYIWKNISNAVHDTPGSFYNNYGFFIKMGYAGSIDWMTGQIYVFNNTILQPNGAGAGGLGTADDGNRHIKHLVTRNNILHVKDITANSISTLSTNEDIDYDYDLLNKGFPAGHETNGFPNATPVYENPAPTLDPATKTGDFRLAPSSPGYDGGTIIPNFMDNFLGNGPDVGAHEAGTPPMVFGVTADYPGSQLPLPVELMTFEGKRIENHHRLTWLTASEINASHTDIEHSKNGHQWSPIGTIQSKNNGIAQNMYTFNYRPTEKDNFYRLKMVDFDGAYKYSSIVFLDGDVTRVTLSPNPAQHQITLSNITEKSTVTIFTQTGLVVYHEIYTGKPINLDFLPSGTYYLSVNDGAWEAFVLK